MIGIALALLASFQTPPPEAKDIRHALAVHCLKLSPQQRELYAKEILQAMASGPPNRVAEAVQQFERVARSIDQKSNGGAFTDKEVLYFGKSQGEILAHNLAAPVLPTSEIDALRGEIQTLKSRIRPALEAGLTGPGAKAAVDSIERKLSSRLDEIGQDLYQPQPRRSLTAAELNDVLVALAQAPGPAPAIVSGDGSVEDLMATSKLEIRLRGLLERPFRVASGYRASPALLKLREGLVAPAPAGNADAWFAEQDKKDQKDFDARLQEILNAPTFAPVTPNAEPSPPAGPSVPSPTLPRPSDPEGLPWPRILGFLVLAAGAAVLLFHLYRSRHVPAAKALWILLSLSALLGSGQAAPPEKSREDVRDRSARAAYEPSLLHRERLEDLLSLPIRLRTPGGNGLPLFW